jgi:hypothetical protein
MHLDQALADLDDVADDAFAENPDRFRLPGAEDLDVDRHWLVKQNGLAHHAAIPRCAFHCRMSSQPARRIRPSVASSMRCASPASSPSIAAQYAATSAGRFRSTRKRACFDISWSRILALSAGDFAVRGQGSPPRRAPNLVEGLDADPASGPVRA